MNLVERPVQPEEVQPEEIGKTAMDLQPDIVLRVYRGDTLLSLWDLKDGQALRSGDTLVLLKMAGCKTRRPNQYRLLLFSVSTLHITG